MRKNRRFKMVTLLLTMVMLLGVMSAIAFADGTTSQGTGPFVVIESRELDSTFVKSAEIKDGKGKSVEFSEETDPNGSYTLKLSVSEPEDGSKELPEDTDYTSLTGVRLFYKLPNAKVVDGENKDVSWTFDEETSEIVFQWKNGKKVFFSADISVAPNYPDTLGISGNYMLITTGTDAVLVDRNYDDGSNRDKLASVGYTVVGGLISPLVDTDPVWTLNHVSGNYYTIKSANNGKYAAVVKKGKGGLTLKDEDENSAQKFLVKQVGNGYAFIYDGNAINNTGNNKESGFASYAYAGSGNEIFNLYAESTIQHSATEDKSGTWVVVNSADKKSIVTANAENAGQLITVSSDDMNGVLMPRNDVSVWTFERVNRDWYTIHTEEGYLNINKSGVSVSGLAQSLLVVIGDGNSFALATGGKDIDYLLTISSGVVKSAAKKGNNAKVTLKTLSEVNVQSTDISGSWAITTDTSGAALLPEAISDKALGSLSCVDYGNGTVCSFDREIPVWNFTKVKGNWYTVHSEQGYLKIENGKISLSAEESLVYIQESDGKYRLTGGKEWALNSINNDPTKGYSSSNKAVTDSSEWHALRKVTDISEMDQLIFNLNGGTTSMVRPKGIAGNAGDVVTLPEINASWNGKPFIGWSDSKNFYDVNKDLGEKSCYHKLYAPGDSFILRNGITTLYAVYDTTKRDVQFGIRMDGVIQDEPNTYNTSDYKGHFTIEGIRNVNTWVIDINGQKPVNGYYIENDVTAALTQVPTAEQIAEALIKEGKIVFDPETQYIHWYVLKYTTSAWHVDGVIRDKAKVGITYDANIDNEREKETVLLTMPGGYQMAVGTRIQIGTNKGETTIKTPARNGYVFKGWNTEKDGTGTQYSEGAYLRMSDNVYLYAQWESVQNGEMVIKIISDWPEGKPAYAGTMITLTAELTGFENKTYTLQWQYSTDGRETWTDEPEANGITMTYELNETTARYVWRVVANDVKNKE